MLCIRFIITCAIPELPSWLATEMAKIEWARREASRTTTTAAPSPPSPEETSKTIGRYGNRSICVHVCSQKRNPLKCKTAEQEKHHAK